MLDDEYHLYLLNEKVTEVEEDILNELFRLLPEYPEVSAIKSSLDQIKALAKTMESKLKAKRFNLNVK